MAIGDSGRRGPKHLVNSKRLKGFKSWLDSVNKPKVVKFWSKNSYNDVVVEKLGEQRKEWEYSPKYEGDAFWIVQSAQSSLETGTPLIDKWVKDKKDRVEFWEILYDFTKDNNLDGYVVINPDQLFNAMREPRPLSHEEVEARLEFNFDFKRLDLAPDKMVSLIDKNVSNTDIFIELAKRKKRFLFFKNKSIIKDNLQYLSDASLADVRKLSDAMGSRMSFGDIVDKISGTNGVNWWLENLLDADKKVIKDDELKSLIQVAGDQKLKLLGILENIYESKGDQNAKTIAFLKLAERKPKGLLEGIASIFRMIFSNKPYYDKNFIKENIIGAELLDQLDDIQTKVGLSSDECDGIKKAAFEDAKAIIISDERPAPDTPFVNKQPTDKQFEIFFSMAGNKDLQTYIKGNRQFDSLAVENYHIEKIVRWMDYLSDASFTEMMLYTPPQPMIYLDPIGSFLDYLVKTTPISSNAISILKKTPKITDEYCARVKDHVEKLPSLKQADYLQSLDKALVNRRDILKNIFERLDFNSVDIKNDKLRNVFKKILDSLNLPPADTFNFYSRIEKHLIPQTLLDDEKLQGKPAIHGRNHREYNPRVVYLMEAHTEKFFEALSKLDLDRKNKVIEIARECLSKKLDRKDPKGHSLYSIESYKKQHQKMWNIFKKINVINAMEKHPEGFLKSLNTIRPLKARQEEIEFAKQCLEGNNGNIVDEVHRRLDALSIPGEMIFNTDEFFKTLGDSDNTEKTKRVIDIAKEGLKDFIQEYQDNSGRIKADHKKLIDRIKLGLYFCGTDRYKKIKNLFEPNDEGDNRVYELFSERIKSLSADDPIRIKFEDLSKKYMRQFKNDEGQFENVPAEIMSKYQYFTNDSADFSQGRSTSPTSVNFVDKVGRLLEVVEPNKGAEDDDVPESPKKRT